MIDWDLYSELTKLVLHSSYEDVKDTLAVFIHFQLEKNIECPSCKKTSPYLDWNYVMHYRDREEEREDGNYQIREVVMYNICPLCKEETADHVVGLVWEDRIE